MPRMIDMIRSSQVPANLMHSAARGSLSIPAGETIEILVYLALHHKLFGQEAQLTLASWDEKACLASASDPATSAEVLGYFGSLENMRPALLPALAENPSVPEETLIDLAERGSRDMVEAFVRSARVMSSRTLLAALQSNAILRPNELAEITKKLAALDTSNVAAANIADAATRASDSAVADLAAADPAAEEVLTAFLKENAAELEREKDKPFQPIGMIHEETAHAAEAIVAATPTAGSASNAAARVAPGSAAATATAHAMKHAPVVHVEKRDSVLQKIAKLDVKGRIALAVRGGKEERSILIRDGTKLVALAVLDSPKVSDGEVEGFAQQKNVLESVLRSIPLKRRFAKNYNIMRNLVCNPRTPLDLSLGLMKNLLVHDLKNLSGNKEVPETIRKLALRMFKQKMEKKNM